MEPSGFQWLYKLANREFSGWCKSHERMEAKLLAAVAVGGLMLTPAFAASSFIERAAGDRAELRPDLLLYAGECRSQARCRACRPRACRCTISSSLRRPPGACRWRVSIAIRARTATPEHNSRDPNVTASPGAVPALDADHLQSRSRRRLAPLCGRRGMSPRSKEPELGDRRTRERHCRRQLFAQSASPRARPWVPAAWRPACASGAAQERQCLRSTSAGPIRCRGGSR